MPPPPVVLLVDDNPDLRLLVEKMFHLRAPQYRLDAVATVDEAIARFGNVTIPFPVAVIVDASLPARSGLELLVEVARWPRVVTVIFSGLRADELRAQMQARCVTADAVVEKTNATVLADLVHGLVTTRGLAMEEEAAE